MKVKRNNGGFTLVEFVVTIAIASMITFAATTMLLLGLRIHHKSNTTAATLNTVSMMYSVMETIASEKNVEIQTDEESWTIVAESTKLEYQKSSGNMLLNETVFVNNVKAAAVSEPINDLLTIYIKTEQNNEYTFSIYCRKGVG